VRQTTAPMSFVVRLVTTFILVLTAGFIVVALRQPASWIPAGILVAVTLFCYALAPVGYALEEGPGARLIVYTRVHEKEFAPVVRCRTIESLEPSPSRFGIRLFGNGGLFAGTGIFWNRTLGVYRAYVTSGRRADLVLVETPKQKIVISPDNPRLFVQSWKAHADANSTRLVES